MSRVGFTPAWHTDMNAYADTLVCVMQTRLPAESSDQLESDKVYLMHVIQ